MVPGNIAVMGLLLLRFALEQMAAHPVAGSSTCQKPSALWRIVARFLRWR